MLEMRATVFPGTWTVPYLTSGSATEGPGHTSTPLEIGDLHGRHDWLTAYGSHTLPFPLLLLYDTSTDWRMPQLLCPVTLNTESRPILVYLTNSKLHSLDPYSIVEPARVRT